MRFCCVFISWSISFLSVGSMFSMWFGFIPCGHSVVPAACRGFPHEGHLDELWQDSSGWPKFQHLLKSAGRGINCLTGNISWATTTVRGRDGVLNKSVTVLVSTLSHHLFWLRISSSELLIGTFRMNPLMLDSDMANVQYIWNSCTDLSSSSCLDIG
ncbi:Uncharacterized protein APZ42_013082, partial [Daphnia magna]